MIAGLRLLVEWEIEAGEEELPQSLVYLHVAIGEIARLRLPVEVRCNTTGCINRRAADGGLYCLPCTPLASDLRWLGPSTAPSRN